MRKYTVNNVIFTIEHEESFENYLTYVRPSKCPTYPTEFYNEICISSETVIVVFLDLL